MRAPTGNASLIDVVIHLASGALLGIFLALSLIVGNSTVLGAISNSAHPPYIVMLLVCSAAALVGVGSAISGFILISLEKNR